MVHYIADLVGRGLRGIQAPLPGLVRRHPAERRGHGPGVRPPRGREVRHARALRDAASGRSSRRWTRAVLQYKPGLLMTPELCEELLERTEVAIGWPRARGPPATPRRHGGRDAAFGSGRARGAWRRDRRRPGGPRQMLAARPLGGERVRQLRPAVGAAHRRGGRDGGARAGAALRRVGGRETGFGVVEHKVHQERGVLARASWSGTATRTWSAPRIDPAARSSRCPGRPAWILALTPSTNPVCSVFFKVILALLTRNAIVVSPHPMARECCADAARLLAAAASRPARPTA